MTERNRVWRWVIGTCAVLLLLGAVVGLQGDGSSDDLSTADGSVASTTIPAAGDAGTAAKVYDQANELSSRTAGGGDAAAPLPTTTLPASAGGGAVGAPLPPTGQQKIVKNATVSVEVKKDGFRQAFDAAASVAAAHGGYVVSSDSQVQKGQVSTGTVVLRVPAAAFDAVRAELGKLGSVKDEHITGEDVTGQLVDLDARLRSLQAQEEAIRALMAKARTIGETIEIQGQLTQVRQQIEQLAGEKARLDSAASLSTIRLHLAEPGAAAEPAPKPKEEASALRRSITRAVHGAELVLAGTIVVLGWAIPLGLLALAGWALWRLAARRARPGPATPTAPTA